MQPHKCQDGSRLVKMEKNWYALDINLSDKTNEQQSKLHNIIKRYSDKLSINYVDKKVQKVNYPRTFPQNMYLEFSLGNGMVPEIYLVAKGVWTIWIGSIMRKGVK